jgi:hypothetical protein
MNWRDDHDLFVSASSDPTSHFCRRFLDDHVQHDGGGGSQGVPIAISDQRSAMRIRSG